MFSSNQHMVTIYDMASGETLTPPTPLPERAGKIESPQVALLDGSWVVFDATTGTMWLENGDKIEVPVDGDGQLQHSGPQTPVVYVADFGGLWEITPQSGAVERSIEAVGTPSKPTLIGQELYAAWLGQNSGTLWNQNNGTLTLEFDSEVENSGDLRPTFATNGARGVVHEPHTGMVWGLPDGELIPLSQWSITDPPEEEKGTTTVSEATEQNPPVAVDDEFGARAGSPAPLPVLLNDYDPNKSDILSIVPESLKDNPLPDDFGEVRLLPDSQSLVIHPTEEATGSASFTYQITDGVNTSEPATVTVTIYPEDVNTAPQWCPVDGCTQEWGVPAIVPGGTLNYPIVEGWVDPEGDPLALADVTVMAEEDSTQAVVTSDGHLAVKHTDHEAADQDIPLELTVRDAHGEETTQELMVPIRQDAQPQFIPSASTVTINHTTTLRPLTRIAGGSGSFELVDASIHTGEDKVDIATRTANGEVSLTPSKAGTFTISLTMRDAITEEEIHGFTRINAIKDDPPLNLPPLRGFIRPLSDATLEILDSIPSADAREVSLHDAQAIEGSLDIQMIDHARIRVSGSTPDGGPGVVGTAKITLTDGTHESSTHLTVFQLPESEDTAIIAAPDKATVRAGSIQDIPVLDNDVAPPGERLALHPDIVDSGAEGELAFASGNTLRYKAPTKPGTYRISYTVYGVTNPSGASDVGEVTIDVVDPDSTTNPEPANVTIRVAPGGKQRVNVPLAGIDPGGSRVFLDSVGPPPTEGISLDVDREKDRIQATVTDSTTPGAHTAEYTVRNEDGRTGTALVRIIVVSPQDSHLAPVASTDHVRVVKGSKSPVTLRPLDNDLDPAGGELRITSVEPNVGESKEKSSRYKTLQNRLDTSHLSNGVVAVKAGEEPGVSSYRYTVESSETNSSSQGLIVVHTMNKVRQQAPVITDTTLTVGQRHQLETSGIDVVTDKVRWATGDPNDLNLSLWSAQGGKYTVEGHAIKGTYPPEGDVVVFKLDGPDATGTASVGYGVLIIPALDDLQLTLKPHLSPITVDEGKSVDISLSTVIQSGPEDELQLREGSFPTSREQADCLAPDSTTIRYTAGQGKPWSDSCQIQAKLVDQSRWSTLSVPISVVPSTPTVELTALDVGVDVGTTQDIDLMSMVGWAGGHRGDASKLRFDVGTLDPSLGARIEGSTLKLSVDAGATPGARHSAPITVSGQGEDSAQLTLRIKHPPVDAPEGAQLTTECTVGQTCSKTVVGVKGEYDPYANSPGAGLELLSLNSNTCRNASPRISGDSIDFTWSDSRGSGEQCHVGFTVQDAQGKRGEGRLDLDARGVPGALGTIEWSDYSENSITLTIGEGSAPNSYPDVDRVEITGPGNASCSHVGGAYRCEVTGLRPGEKGTFSAQAVNSSGSSTPTSTIEAWAYRTPPAPKIRVTQVDYPTNTDRNSGRVRVSVEGSSDTKRIQVSGPGTSTTVDASQGSTPNLTVPAGRQTFTAVAESSLPTPPIQSSSPSSGSATAEVTVIGAPSLKGVSVKEISDTSVTLSASGVSADGAEVRYRYGVTSGSSGTKCTQSSATVTNLESHAHYTPTVCISTKYGTAQASGKEFQLGGKLPRLTNQTFEVSTKPQGRDNSFVYGLVHNNPATATVKGSDVWVEYSTGPTISLDAKKASNDLEVRQCKKVSGQSLCSDWAPIKPAQGSPPTMVVLKQRPECAVPGDESTARAGVDVSAGAEPYLKVTAPDDDGRFEVSFTGPFSMLEPKPFSSALCPESDSEKDQD